jgi:hypothetical protein
MFSALEFGRDEDFESENHRTFRNESWFGGPYSEVPYFLSCLTRTNYVRTRNEVWQEAAKQFISSQAPESEWITGSHYFFEFAVLILKDLYRASQLGKRHPIRNEHREERITRGVIAHAHLSIEALATQLKITVKQLNRNCIAMLAHREFRRLTAEP